MNRRTTEVIELLKAMWRARFRGAVEIEQGITAEYLFLIARVVDWQPRCEIGISLRVLELAEPAAIAARFRTAMETAATNPGVRWFLPLSGELEGIKNERS